jgi:DNA modification methylase
MDTVWGGDEDCEHRWTTEKKTAQGGCNTEDNPPDVGANKHTQDTRLRGGDGIESNRCVNCGAWRGQLGLEPSLDQYVRNIVEVARELRRVLRDDGSWWLNLGDSYAGSGGAGGDWQENSESVKPNPTPDEKDPSELNGGARNGALKETNLKRKNKMLVPHRVAIALQEDGWVVRNDVTWLKPNPMPSSVKDRLNTCTEQVFHLTPEPDYWYDLDAIREPHKEKSLRRRERSDTERWGEKKTGQTEHTGFADEDLHPAGKNPGDVFEVTTKPYPDAHFAVYPSELCEKPIKATCPPKICADCGAPYERDVERETSNTNNTRPPRNLPKGQQDQKRRCGDTVDIQTKGWTPTCDCDTSETEPGIALDPFAGAGTTCMVAKRERRRFVGIDLNGEYVEMARNREMEERAGKVCDGQRQATLGDMAATDGGGRGE